MSIWPTGPDSERGRGVDGVFYDLHIHANVWNVNYKAKHLTWRKT